MAAINSRAAQPGREFQSCALRTLIYLIDSGQATTICELYVALEILGHSDYWLFEDYCIYPVLGMELLSPRTLGGVPSNTNIVFTYTRI